MAETFQAKSIIIGRMPRKRPEEFKTAFIKSFDSLDPFTAEFPKKEFEFPNTEKVVIVNSDSNLNYFLEGNDLVFTGISQFSIDQKGNVIELSVRK